jgi:hypothetical protein
MGVGWYLEGKEIKIKNKNLKYILNNPVPQKLLQFKDKKIEERGHQRVGCPVGPESGRF